MQLVDEYDASKTCNRCAYEGVRETQGRFECPEFRLDDNTDKIGALNIGKRALRKFSKPPSEPGAVLAQPETQVIAPRDDEPANLLLTENSTPSGGTHGFSRERTSKYGSDRKKSDASKTLGD